MNVSLRQTGDLVTPSLRRKLAAVRDKRPYLSTMGTTVVQIARGFLNAFMPDSIRAWDAPSALGNTGSRRS